MTRLSSRKNKVSAPSIKLYFCVAHQTLQASIGHSSTTIQTLQQLLDILPTCSGDDYAQIATRLSIPIDDFLQYAEWSDDCYKRNCIVETEKYELLLLCWKKGQNTPIHDHGGEECWVYVVNGELQECLYKEGSAAKPECTEQHLRLEGSISYMEDSFGYHSLEPLTDTVITLHLYMNPIASCMCFDQASEQFVEKVFCNTKLETAARE